MAAGLQIAKNPTVQDAVLSTANSLEDWTHHLYRWHHVYVEKMKGDLESLGCTAVVQNSFTLKQRCRIAGCELVSAATTVHTGKVGNTL